MYSVAKRFLGASGGANVGKFDYTVNSIDCNADGSIIVAQIQCASGVSTPVYPTVLVSTNGGSSFFSVIIDPTIHVPQTGVNVFYNVVCNGTRFVVSFGGYIYYSDNGSVWTRVTMPSGSTALAVTYQGGKFITSDSTYIIDSSDGVTWTKHTMPRSIDATVDTNYPEQGLPVFWIPSCTRYLVGDYTYNTSWADEQPVTYTGFSSGTGPASRKQVIDGVLYLTNTYLGEMSSDGTTVTNLSTINSNNRFSQILPSSHDIYAIWGNTTPYVGTLPSFPNLPLPPTAERSRLILAAVQTQCISYDAINDIIKTISNTGLTETNVVSSANLSVGGNWFVGPIESFGMQGSSSYKRFFIREPLAGSVPVAADDITTIPTIAVLTYSAGTYTLTHSTISI